MQRSLESNGADHSEPFIRRLLGLQEAVRRFYLKRNESADLLFNYPDILLLPIRPANPTVTL